MPDVLAGASEGLERCAACRLQPWRLARVVVLADYRDRALREWVLSFKHGGRADLATPLAAALAMHVERTLGWRGDGRVRVLCPVPLHRWRRLERGYDQARRLADELARELGVRCAPALVRTRSTAVQGASGSSTRSSNVRGAFAVRQSAFAGFTRLALPRLISRADDAAAIAAADETWLVDDVITSGATLRECARALRRVGARRVCALALARADGQHAEGAISDGPRSDDPMNDGPRNDGPRNDGPRNDGPRNERRIAGHERTEVDRVDDGYSLALSAAAARLVPPHPP